MKGVTAANLAASTTLYSTLQRALYIQLGIHENHQLHQKLIGSLAEQDYKGLLYHVGHSQGKGVGSYAIVATDYGWGWEVSNYLSHLAGDISNTINACVEHTGRQAFKGYNPTKTLLPKPHLEEAWMEVSKLCGEKIAKVYTDSSFEIPGLVEAIDTGSIHGRFGQIMTGPSRQAEIALVRRFLQERLPFVNDQEQLISRFRNALFDQWQKNYGLFLPQEELTASTNVSYTRR